jgi:hypothetical protein
MSPKRRNPKKDKAARRRRPDMPGLRRAQLRLDDVLDLLSGAPPGALPLIALPMVWLWNMSEDGHAAAHCVDGCLVLHNALAEYGLESEIQAVGVAITGDGPPGSYGQAPRYSTDGSFKGHTILLVPAAARFIDPTIQQFPEIPQSARNTLPLMAQLPAGTQLGEDVFVIPRRDHTVAYLPLPAEQRRAWQDPRIDAHAAEYREAGANLAANVFDIMRHEALRDRLQQSPYPRLRTLLNALDGTKGVAGDGRGYRFADPATGALASLSADIPLSSRLHQAAHSEIFASPSSGKAVAISCRSSKSATL